MKSKAEIEREIERQIAIYFGIRNQVTDVNIPSLAQRVALQLEGREVYVSIPFDPNAPKPNWEAITEYAKHHPEVKALLWLNGQIKEL